MIHFSDVSFAYRKPYKRIFENFVYEINSGEIVAIVGRSGVGKSTLLELVLGNLQPDTGSIHISDNVKFGPIFQTDSLLPWLTPLENLNYVDFLRGKGRLWGPNPEGEEVLSKVGIDKKWQHVFPKTLSSGMRKRVEIARALYSKATFLVCDEPFATLDVATKREVLDIALPMMKNEQITGLFVTHGLEEAIFLGDRISVIQHHNEACNVINIKNKFAGLRLEQIRSQGCADIYIEFSRKIESLILSS